MRYNCSLFLVLFIAWLLMSGHLETLPVVFGIISCILVIYLSRRMNIIDGESHPLHLSLSLPVYWVWLSWQILKSNIDVALRIMHPKMPISPRLFKLRNQQTSDLARVIYANSITLTPGTVTTDLTTTDIQIHALSVDGEKELKTGTMASKVASLEMPK